MAEFYYTAYSITFIIYTAVIGSGILLYRKLKGYKNSIRKIILAYGIGFVEVVIFFLIDSFLFLPLLSGNFLIVAISLLNRFRNMRSDIMLSRGFL